MMTKRRARLFARIILVGFGIIVAAVLYGAIVSVAKPTGQSIARKIEARRLAAEAALADLDAERDVVLNGGIAGKSLLPPSVEE